MLLWLFALSIIAVMLTAYTNLTYADNALDMIPEQASEEAYVAADGDVSQDSALAGEGSGRDVTIHFGDDEEHSISIHVNPENSEEESDSFADPDSETDAETGLKAVEAGDFVIISSVDGSLLPEEAEANAEILSGKAENTAVEKVEEAAGAESVSAAADPAESIANDRKGIEPEGPKTAPEAESAAEAVEKTEYQVFDISLDNVDEEQYQEGFKVEVSLPEDVKGRDFRLFHIHEGEEPVEIPIETVGAVDPETGLEVVSGFEFKTDGFSEFVLQYKYTVTSHIEINGKLYEVTVTYDEAANIPEGSTLRLTEFSEDDEEYEYARNAVLADKKARGEWVDLSSFGLAALDISIMNPEGEEIEPEAPVQVEIRIKELPGVEDLSEIADTLEIQHHVEVKDGVVVENVFGGNTDASFRLETDEAVAADGIVIDPDSVRVEEFVMPETFTPHQGKDADEDIEVSFRAPVFSTFTVTWNGTNSISDSVSYLWATAAGVDSYQFKDDGSYDGYYSLPTNNLHFMNSYQLGIPGYIFRTPAAETAKGDLYLVYHHTGNGTGDQNVSEADSTFHIYFKNNGNTYADVTVHYVDSDGNPIRRTKTSNVSYTGGSVDTRYVDGTNSNKTLSNYAGSKNGYRFVGVSEVKPSNQSPHATIHYVDEAGNELTVRKGSISSSTLLNNYAYLIYDIEGGEYEYKETYLRRNSTDTPISAYLNWDGTNWYATSGNNQKQVNENDDIYVVYKKKTTPAEGGKPTLVELEDDEKPEAPTVTKDSAVNGDGTNTLSLSVTSHTRPREVLKLADVIVIFDRSGSMKENIDNSDEASSTAKRRMTLLQNAVNGLAEDLIGDNSQYIYTDKNGRKHKQIEMSLVSFSTEATNATAFTDNAGTFKGWVNALTPDGGTNWEQALQKANEKSVDEGRATFVIFVTDGEPTFRMSRMTDTDSSLVNDIYFPYSYSTLGSFYCDNNVYGKGDRDVYERDYEAALTQAKAIVDKNKNLYMIGVGPEVKNLEQFNADAGADGYYPATSSDQLTAAFEDIKKRIAALAGYSDFQISDGITDLTQTVQKSALVDFAEDDFTYYKGKVVHTATQADVNAGRAKKIGDPVVLTWNNWNPTSEGCAEAKYENGAVVWNMGSGFMPQEGYTYQVRFKVWPSQAAYDLLADLNNGVKSYASLSDAEKAQIKEPATAGGMYTLKTNSDTSYNYKDATIVDGTVTTNGGNLLNPPGAFGDVDPLELTTTPLKVRKQWHNNYVDSRELTDSITMKLYGVDPDGTSHEFKEITLTRDGGWNAEENYVSYGLVTYTTDSDAKIYETGHDFTLRETDDEAHYYELAAGVYRPMFINGKPTMLERLDTVPAGMDSGVFHYSDGSNHYYRLDGKVYRDTGSDILVLATNSHRSYMDITKTVTTEDENDAVSDKLFEFEVTFTVPDDIDNYATEKYIFASVKDENGNDLNHLTQVEKTNGFWVPSELAAKVGASVSDYSQFDTKQRIIVSGESFSVKIKPGWRVRFVNLPKGTIYSMKEINVPEDYEFVKAEVSGTQWIANMENGVDNGSAAEMTGLPSDNSNAGISGSITEANARYSTTYTNKALTQHVNIQKTSQDSTTPLPGAVFSLYTESDYKADPKKASKTGLTSDKDGKVDLGKLAYGMYYLVETSAPAGYILLPAPVVIIVSRTGVTYNQSDSSLSLSGNGINHNAETGLYTLTVTNNAGYELPSSGGPGTRLFTILGSILVLGAGVLLWRRRRIV